MVEPGTILYPVSYTHLMLSIGEYLIFYLLLKMLVCYVIVLLMVWLAQQMSSSAGAVLGIGFIGIVEYLLYLPVSYTHLIRQLRIGLYGSRGGTKVDEGLFDNNNGLFYYTDFRSSSWDCSWPSPH